MIVGLDARTIFHPQRRGIGNSLLEMYRRLATDHPDCRLLFFHRGQREDNPFVSLPNVESRIIDIKGDRCDLWQQVRLPLAAKRAGVDLLHCPANTAPRWPFSPLILTIHDLIPLDPRFAASDSPAWGRRVAHAARRACRILTPSQYTRRQLIETFHLPPEKIIVNPWAPVTAPSELPNVAASYRVPADKPYVFVLGSADPRKNTAGILRAFAALPPALRRNHHLLIVGIQNRALPDFQSLAAELGIADDCSLHGFIPEGHLSLLLSGARVFCYPSLSEGFGLPILDAFLCHTAVLTADNTSLPEVAGDAALLVDAQNHLTIADALGRLLSDEALRKELIARGAARVVNFTWSACARRLYSVFVDALHENG